MDNQTTSKDGGSFQERMSKRPLRDVYLGSENLWGYRAAAATLASFEVEHLQPFQEDAGPEARAQLLVECDAVSTGKGRARWSLRTPVRQPTLRRLFESGSLTSALQANSKRDSSATQRIFESCIDLNSPPPAFPENVEDAAAMLEVSYWLQSVPTLWQRMPSRDSIRRFIGREQLLEPFRNLVGNHFAGRQAELSTLSDYVGVFAATSVSETLVRVFENIFSIVERPPLFVLGPGGSGKSTLIAEFVLEHAEHEDHAQFPFAYLDFDRAALLAEEPISLLFEVMRQLSVQYQQAADSYKAVVQKWTARFYAQAQELEVSPDATDDANDSYAEIRTVERVDGPALQRPLDTPFPSSNVKPGKPLRLQERDNFLAEFVEFVQALQPSNSVQPLLLVLDTFEEVQFRSSASEDDVFDFLAQLQERIPRLRTVICGRAEIASTRYKVRELKLGNFDEPAALAFLRLLGIEKEGVAKAIFDQVGGSPLVLRLAADVATKEDVGEKGIEGLGARWLETFRSESVEVVLYRRILLHVYDERIQRLANPGLVLRYVTPEILLEVLGPACKVHIDGMAEARALVKGMRNQLATILVPFGGDETLAHRPDMRSILLTDLTTRAKKDKSVASTLEEIHRLAVAFYARSDDAGSRAEEFFHRLSLRQNRAILKPRWRDDIGPYLGSAILELPPEAQSFVAARAGFEVSDDIWNQAVEEDWVLLAARRLRDLVQLGKLQDAADTLRKRQKRWDLANLAEEYRSLIEIVLSGYARFYEGLRLKYESGNERTQLMSKVVSDVRKLGRDLRLDQSYAESLFSKGLDGDRVIGLAIAQAKPQQTNITMAIEAIGSAQSPFEQFQGLVLADSLDKLSPSQRAALREALLLPKGVPFHSSDPSRLKLRDGLLKKWPKAEDKPPSKMK